MTITHSRAFVPGVFLAYVAFASFAAGAASSGAGLVVLALGIFAAVILDFARWHAEDAGRTTLAAPFRPDPYGILDALPVATSQPSPEPPPPGVTVVEPIRPRADTSGAGTSGTGTSGTGTTGAA